MDLGGLYSQTKPFTRQSMVFGDPRARLFGGTFFGVPPLSVNFIYLEQTLWEL